MRVISTLSLLLIAMLWMASVAAAGMPTARGLALANACAACHGPNGHSQGAIPSIDNLPAAKFTAALKAFRTNARQGTVMNLIAKGLDDADIDAIAAYITTQHKR